MFFGPERSNQTHELKTDPEVLLAQRGRRGAKLSYTGNLLVEHGAAGRKLTWALVGTPHA